MATTLRELTVKLGVNVDAGKLRRFDQALGNTIDKTQDLTRNLRRVGEAAERMGRSLTLKLSAPLLALGGFSVKAAAEVEQLRLTYRTLLQDAEKGDKLFQDILDFEAKTPFNLQQVQQAAGMLLGSGEFAGEEIIGLLKDIGTVTKGVNGDLTRVILNFNQVATNGILQGRDLRDFNVNMIPISAALAKMYGVQRSEIKKMVEEGKVGFQDVRKAFAMMAGEGGRFEGMLEKQSQTLGGLFTTFNSELFKFRAQLGKLLVEEFELDKKLRSLIATFRKITQGLRDMDPLVRKIVLGFGLFLILLGPLLILVGKAIGLFSGLLTVLALMNLTVGTTGTAGLVFSFAKLKLILLGIIAPLKAAAVAAWAFVAPWIGMIAVYAAVLAAFLVLIDDIAVWIEGGDSMIGQLLGPWERWADDMLTFWREVKGGWDALMKGLTTGNWDDALAGAKHFLKTMKFLFLDFWEWWTNSAVGKFLARGGRHLANFVGAGASSAGQFNVGGRQVTAAEFQDIVSGRSANLAGVQGGTATSSRTVNVNSEIKIGFPEGTSPAAAALTQKQMEDAARRIFSGEVTKVLNSTESD